MFDSRKQNPNCNFAEEIVSYVYDEMTETDKSNFEKHLINCSPCNEEISAFSSISFSIQEWRDKEFAHLPTPNIEIPYETETETIHTVETTNVSKSWTESLRNIFTISPAFLKTATAFGALAIVIGLGWFLMNNQNDIAEKEKNLPKNETISSPNLNEDVKEEKLIVNTQENKDTETPDKIEKPNIEIAEKTVIKKPKSNNSKTVTKRKKLNKKPTIAKNNSKQKPTPKKDVVKPNLNKQKNIELQQAPRLSEEFAIEDTEDKDLRLTDLLDDVGTDK